MENEKRMIADYTVLCAVNVGKREVVLACDKHNKDGEKFVCGFAEQNGIFERYEEFVGSDDYIEIARLFGSRIVNETELFKEQVENLGIPVTVITQDDCIPDHYKNDINGKIIAINSDIFKPEYQRADRQLFLVTGGFGASANSRGSAVFCKNLYDGKTARYERMDVLGEVKPECMPDWAKEKAEAISRKHKTKEQERYRHRLED